MSFRFISFFSLQKYYRYFTPMQEKPYPFRGIFLKLSFSYFYCSSSPFLYPFLFPFPHFFVSFCTRFRKTPYLCTRKFGKANERSFHTQNRGIDFCLYP